MRSRLILIIFSATVVRAFGMAVDPSEAPNACMPIPLTYSNSCYTYVECDRVDVVSGKPVPGPYDGPVNHAECDVDMCKTDGGKTSCSKTLTGTTSYKITFSSATTFDIKLVKEQVTVAFEAQFQKTYSNTFSAEGAPRKHIWFYWDLYKQVNVTLPVVSTYTCTAGYSAKNLLLGVPCSAFYYDVKPVTYPGGELTTTATLSDGFGDRVSIRAEEVPCVE
ncbi:MAG: hypothetical protein H0W83_01745 [Planctomycetes bacterium]|nr:hypothetical protein [Planctomycetota bacterium]